MDPFEETREYHPTSPPQNEGESAAVNAAEGGFGTIARLLAPLVQGLKAALGAAIVGSLAAVTMALAPVVLALLVGGIGVWLSSVRTVVLSGLLGVGWLLACAYGTFALRRHARTVHLTNADSPDLPLRAIAWVAGVLDRATFRVATVLMAAADAVGTVLFAEMAEAAAGYSFAHPVAVGGTLGFTLAQSAVIYLGAYVIGHLVDRRRSRSDVPGSSARLEGVRQGLIAVELAPLLMVFSVGVWGGNDAFTAVRTLFHAPVEMPQVLFYDFVATPYPDSLTYQLADALGPVSLAFLFGLVPAAVLGVCVLSLRPRHAPWLHRARLLHLQGAGAVVVALYAVAFLSLAVRVDAVDGVVMRTAATGAAGTAYAAFKAPSLIAGLAGIPLELALYFAIVVTAFASLRAPRAGRVLLYAWALHAAYVAAATLVGKSAADGQVPNVVLLLGLAAAAFVVAQKVPLFGFVRTRRQTATHAAFAASLLAAPFALMQTDALPGLARLVAADSSGECVARALAPVRADRIVGEEGAHRLAIVAHADKLSPVRVTVDDEPRRPYWVEHGEAVLFHWNDRIVIEGDLPSTRLALDGYGYTLPADADREATLVDSLATALAAPPECADGGRDSR